MQTSGYMEFWGIKIDKELIPSLIVKILLVVLVVWFVKITLGSTLSNILLCILVIWIILEAIASKLVFRKIADYCRNRPKKYNLKNWTSDCIERAGRLQRCDFINLNLENKYIHNLTFKTTLICKNGPIWRAGVIIGNPGFKPENVIDSEIAITCHTGQPPEAKNMNYVWVYDKNHNRNNAYSTSTINRQKTTIFDISVTKNNYMRININNQLVYSEGIEPSFRKKVYLIAWGDSNDCKVKFSDINYSSI